MGANDAIDSVTFLKIRPEKTGHSKRLLLTHAPGPLRLARWSFPRVSLYAIRMKWASGPFVLQGLLTWLYGSMIHNSVRAHFFPVTIFSISWQMFSQAPCSPCVHRGKEFRVCQSLYLPFPSFLLPPSPFFYFSLDNSLVFCILNIVPGCEP